MMGKKREKMKTEMEQRVRNIGLGRNQFTC